MLINRISNPILFATAMVSYGFIHKLAADISDVDSVIPSLLFLILLTLVVIYLKIDKAFSSCAVEVGVCEGKEKADNQGNKLSTTRQVFAALALLISGSALAAVFMLVFFFIKMFVLSY